MKTVTTEKLHSVWIFGIFQSVHNPECNESGDREAVLPTQEVWAAGKCQDGSSRDEDALIRCLWTRRGNQASWRVIPVHSGQDFWWLCAPSYSRGPSASRHVQEGLWTRMKSFGGFCFVMFGINFIDPIYYLLNRESSSILKKTFQCSISEASDWEPFLFEGTQTRTNTLIMCTSFTHLLFPLKSFSSVIRWRASQTSYGMPSMSFLIHNQIKIYTALRVQLIFKQSSLHAETMRP